MILRLQDLRLNGDKLERTFDKVLVSACLIGQKVRYDGSAKLAGHAIIERWHNEGRIVALCPEVAAGFPTPRLPAEIQADQDGTAVAALQARVFESNGNDVTKMYLSAGQIAVDLATKNGCKYALLTDGSPSCGSTYIYDGQFKGSRKPGVGSTTALLMAAGVEVFPETAIEELDRKL